MAARLPAATRGTLVRAGGPAGLPSPGLLLVVVLLRRGCAGVLRRGGHQRGLGRVHLRRRCDRQVGLASARSKDRRDLRLGTVGQVQRGQVRRSARSRRRGARQAQSRLSPTRRAGACAVLCAYTIRQGRRLGRADAADLAGLGHRPRHQGRELAAYGRLSRQAWTRAAVRHAEHEVASLQSAAASEARWGEGTGGKKRRRQSGRAHGPVHVLGFAPARSGKGVGLVVPTLRTWPGSAIVHDIKGENWQLTAGFRARHGRVLLFDPTNTKSSAYNPLLEVRRGEWEVRDVQNVADVLVDPEGSLEKRNHWEKTSHSLLVGAILHVLYAEPDKTLAGVAGFLSDPKRPIETTLAAMMTTRHLGEDGPHPVVA